MKHIFCESQWWDIHRDLPYTTAADAREIIDAQITVHIFSTARLWIMSIFITAAVRTCASPDSASVRGEGSVCFFSPAFLLVNELPSEKKKKTTAQVYSKQICWTAKITLWNNDRQSFLFWHSRSEQKGWSILLSCSQVSWQTPLSSSTCYCPLRNLELGIEAIPIPLMPDHRCP